MDSAANPGIEILASICQENLSVYEASAGRLQEDVSQESQVAEDYRGRLVYELLQNADDAFGGRSTTDDRALFRLTDNELWVANTGRPFTEADVRGLCGLGASSKVRADAPKRASIGHKGLGFKSVLEITDAPEAYSESVSFRLGQMDARRPVESLWAQLGRGDVRAVPAMRFPSALGALDPYWDELQRIGFRAAFRFPLKERVTAEHRERLGEQLLKLPMTSVLFLKHLENVVIEVDTEEFSDHREWLLERRKVTSQGQVRCGGLVESGLFRVDLVNRDGDGDTYWVAHNADVKIGQHREGLSGPAWDGVDLSEVSVAVLSAEDPQLDPETRRFHVFLPTQEPAACSVLINGAFGTDLSRRHVKVTDSAVDYNSHLIREAAKTFADVLVPHLIEEGGPGYVLRVLSEENASSGEAAEVTRMALSDALADTPLLPAGEYTLSLRECVLPTPLLGDRGHEFAELLREGTIIEERRVPDPQYCAGSLAIVAETYGAHTLDPSETLRVLAENVDPAKSLFQSEVEGRFFIDPLLDLCVAIWEQADYWERIQLEEAAREESVFPIGRNADGTVNRIALGEQKAFYPPRSSTEDLPLREIQFLAHAVCWGTLDRSEQSAALEEQMAAWTSLFDIKEFRFDEVMRAAVLPGLTRTGEANLELQEANRTIETLATICRLAGSTIKNDQPLPLSRLGSDRAYFNLSRLEVPCRAAPGKEPEWIPAYRVYFGRDWVGSDSIEEVADAMASAGHPLDIHYLAAPAVFAAYSSTIGVDSDDLIDAAAYDADDDEVDLDDDTDEVMETTADERWRNFFAWLGVSRGLRLIHFHDVDDTATGWVSTKALGLPGGWAFNGFSESWSEYRKELERTLESDGRWDSSDHYLYRVHNLDRLDEIVAAARLKDNEVAQELLTHLARNWSAYSAHTQAELALVEAGKVPSQRAKPPRAKPEELVTGGPNFWLFRLRQHAICPTSHGPRRPDLTWRRSDELVRRLGRSGRDPGDFVPVLKPLDGVAATLLRPCLDELCVRGELTPAVFGIDDARDLCVRVSRLYDGSINDQVLRSELRPIYRQMFELLVGSTSESEATLSGTPLAARTSDGVRFMPAREVVYASVSGSRERSGVQNKVPIFVLEAEANAKAPLRNIFGTEFLENALTWTAMPGELALDDEQLRDFRAGLQELLAPLLARLSADRAERGAEDRRLLSQFIAAVEPVESLMLRCSFNGDDLGKLPSRTYYVEQVDSDLKAFVVWSGDPWPPTAEDAQTLALAMAETLEVNSVETFLSFINAKPEQRLQLLDLAGAGERLDEVTHELAADLAGEDAGLDRRNHREAGDLAPTDGESTETDAPKNDRIPEPPAAQVATRVPLHRFEDLLIDGKVIRISGSGSQADAGASQDSSDSGGEAGLQPGGSPRAAAGTDLNELDRLGMRITFEFERRRFDGQKVVVLPGDESPRDADVLIVDVGSPSMIKAAGEQSDIVRNVLEHLAQNGISELYPGFDVMTVVDGDVDRMIELKSSTMDAQTQFMSWNEWKTAAGSLRHRFWLYLVGNLRADLNNPPFVRAVRDPFGTLESSTLDDTIRKRTIQLRVREFEAADELKLTVRTSSPDGGDVPG